MAAIGSLGGGQQWNAPKANAEASKTEDTAQISTNKQEEVIYIDPSQFSGDELELIKLVNLIVEYQNKGDEMSYFSLFNSQLDPGRKIHYLRDYKNNIRIFD